jgi:hypothetical protein
MRLSIALLLVSSVAHADPAADTDRMGFKTLIDGKQCDTHQEYAADYVDAWVVEAGGPVFLGRDDGNQSCSSPLVAIGKHAVTVEVWATKTRRTDRHEVLAAGRIHFLEVLDRTKRLATGTVTCKTADDKLQNIWNARPRWLARLHERARARVCSLSVRAGASGTGS